MWVGTGVGGGLILNGEPYRGQGAAAEIGHIIVKPGGRVCSDGRKGHLEAYAGRGRMEVYARELHEGGRKTNLFKIMEKKGRTRMSSGVIAEALEEGDKLAQELIDGAVGALATGLASVQNLLALEAIVIGGGLADRLGPPSSSGSGRRCSPCCSCPIIRRRCCRASSATSPARWAPPCSQAADRGNREERRRDQVADRHPTTSSGSPGISSPAPPPTKS